MAQWQTFWTWFLRTLFAVALVLAGLIWIIDPYESIPFSPPLERATAASNQRYAYPAVARNPAFDSLIVGTSTARLLVPDALNGVFGARFANLSMNSATAYEQMRIAEVFARNHTHAKTLIIGIDVVWCENQEKIEKYTFRRFPEWMYDANPWNDLLHLIEFKTFEVLGRQAGFLLGLREARYGRDGYRNFLPPESRYNVETARKKIYGTKGDVAVPDHDGVVREVAEARFPSHVYLERLLASYPGQTQKLLVFVPYHAHHQPKPGTLEAASWNTCKSRVRDIASQHHNTSVIDFMIASPITTRDENYWDPLHYNLGVANQLAQFIGLGARGITAPNGEYMLLAPDS